MSRCRTPTAVGRTQHRRVDLLERPNDSNRGQVHDRVDQARRGHSTLQEERHPATRSGEHLVTFKVADLFQTDIREASVVMLYLLPELNRRLMPKLKSELRPGSRVVSHDFDMGRDWPAEQSRKFERDEIYLWTIK